MYRVIKISIILRFVSFTNELIHSRYKKKKKKIEWHVQSVYINELSLDWYVRF